MKTGEEFKIALQAHSGRYEFRVMAFGLIGALATFLKAMNTTLRPPCASVFWYFFDDVLIFSRTYEEHLGTFDRC